jgi:zinc protease
LKPITALLLAAGILSPSLAFCRHPGASGPTQKTGKPAAGRGAAVKVTSVEGITEYRLANGLRVLLFPMPASLP